MIAVEDEKKILDAFGLSGLPVTRLEFSISSNREVTVLVELREYDVDSKAFADIVKKYELTPKE